VLAEQAGVPRRGLRDTPCQPVGGHGIREEARTEAQAHQPCGTESHPRNAHARPVAGAWAQGVLVFDVHGIGVCGHHAAPSAPYRQDSGWQALHPHQPQENQRGGVHPPAPDSGTDT